MNERRAARRYHAVPNGSRLVTSGIGLRRGLLSLRAGDPMGENTWIDVPTRTSDMRPISLDEKFRAAIPPDSRAWGIP
jgi:hypothetical protein